MCVYAPTHTHTDVKDILGVPRGPPGADKPEVKAKPEKMKRPEGMSREAFALLGGSNPVIPTHLLGTCLLVRRALFECSPY